MDGSQSVSQWLANLKRGDHLAAQELWSRYASRLVDYARHRLGNMQKGIADEEDVAQIVFASLCRGAACGRFEDVNNRDELWWMLLAITKRKATDHMRRETAQKRGGGRVFSESHIAQADGDTTAVWSFDDLVGSDPTPEYLSTFAEQCVQLMSKLRDDRLRRIAVLRIEGYTVSEISSELSIAIRSVERKLHLIRTEWSCALTGE